MGRNILAVVAVPIIGCFPKLIANNEAMLIRFTNIKNSDIKRKLISNFLSLSTIQFFTYILPIIYTPYLIRTLGVNNFGLVTFAKSITMYFNVIVDYGFELSATRMVSMNRYNQKKISEIFTNVMVIKIILIFISFTLLSIIVFSFDELSVNRKLYYAAFLIVIGHALSPRWYFQGIEEMQYLAFVDVVSKLLIAVMIFLLINDRSEYYYEPIIIGSNLIITGVVSLLFISQKQKKIFDFRALKLRHYAQDGYHIFLSTLSSVVLSASPAIFIGTFVNYTILGYYSAFEKLVVAFHNMFAVINKTFYPRLSSQYVDNFDSYFRLWKRIALLTLLGSCVLWVFILFSGKFVILFLGENFVDYIYILKILSFTIVLYAIKNSLGLNGLLVLGKYREMSKSQILPATLFIIFSFVVLIYLDLINYILLILLTDIFIIMIRLFDFRKSITNELQ